MSNTPFRLFVPVAAALALSACASKPKPTEAPAVVQESRPAPAPQDESAARGGPAARSLQADLAATAGDLVFFDLDSHSLTAEGEETLAKQARWLAQHPDLRVLVAGNCDERGTREYNLALGARRANAARDALVRAGVSASRIDTVSYGKERPIDPGSFETAWSRNRNAHTVLLDVTATW